MKGYNGMRTCLLIRLVVAILFALPSAPARVAVPDRGYDVEEKGIREIQADLEAGRVSSETLVRSYLKRIFRIDRAGPQLHAVLALNANAISDARRLDAERRNGHLRGPLHGIPILLKDNIESNDSTATTAGSLALLANATHRDAAVVRRIKDAGGIILGKNNLAEWGLIRSSRPIDAWSAVGGIVKNPYALDRSPCGSSSGTAVAVAASLATVGVGTETNGSITCPASYNDIVGLKPTVGLVSRTSVIPISRSQDTPGPLGRSVTDVAILLTVIAGSDSQDPMTQLADLHKVDYRQSVAHPSLNGKRLGVLRYATGFSAAVDLLFEQSLEAMRQRGVQIVELPDFKPPESMWPREMILLRTEFKDAINQYLATTSKSVLTRTLADVIQFNRNSAREMMLFGQEGFEEAQSTGGITDPSYLAARESLHRDLADNGIDALVDRNSLDALIAPTFGPPYRLDLVTGRHESGDAASLPAIAGYPHLTVPMGFINGLPVGLSFIGKAWSEPQLLELGAAFEQAIQARRRPSYTPSVESSLVFRAVLKPIGQLNGKHSD